MGMEQRQLRNFKALSLSILITVAAALTLAGTPSSSADVISTTTSSRKPKNLILRDTSPLTHGSDAVDRGRSFFSTVVFPVYGNVYPLGIYYVSINIGDPPKPYFLDVDTGSDVTWLQCDAPCVSCSKVPHPLYRPAKTRLVPCKDAMCMAVHESTNHEGVCGTPHEQCDYEIEYQDHGSSLGVLVADAFALRLANSSLAHARLAFGCGYNQQGGPSHGPNGSSDTDGVLGLGSGQVSILSQLRGLSICRSIVGHCLGRQRSGFLFFGDDIVPPQGVTWAPMSRGLVSKYYSPGMASVFVGKQQLAEKQAMVLDSGSSYTYFTNQLYQSFISMIRNDILKTTLKEAPEEKALPLCWKGAKPFSSILELNKYFHSIILGFRNGKSLAYMKIPPESYFIVTKQGNACLGILNGNDVGLKDFNLIGDIWMQDLLVVYDNEKQRIGWARVAGCHRIINSEDGEDDWFQFRDGIPHQFHFSDMGFLHSSLFTW